MPATKGLGSFGISQRLSAVVVNYDAGEAIGRCLASLLESGIDDIAVVDNGSTDGSVELVRHLEAPLKLIQPSRNLGYGAAVNQGVAATAGEFVFVCNPDLVVEPGAVELFGSRARCPDRRRRSGAHALGARRLGLPLRPLVS